MSIGETLPIWSIIPFVGMLLSIALFPLFKAEWWEKNELQVAIAWSLVFLVPFTIAYGIDATVLELEKTILLDYVPFIVLLLGLFTVAGGIHLKGNIVGSTKNNLILLGVGTFLASWIGTTGAAMVMIRPVLRANSWRKHKEHVVIFFIFLVANMGGCLTPLGDPPLFLGFLRGVPFFWTLEHIWPILLLNVIIMLVVFYFIDRHFYKKEDPAHLENLELERKATKREPMKIEGLYNVPILILIVLAVLSNGIIPSMPIFQDASGTVIGISLNDEVHLGINWFVEIILIFIAMAISWKLTPKQLRDDNEFTWDPIAEVAKLFIGIFITMIPALALLSTHGSQLGLDHPLQFFWATGALSSFLDNSPTYVVFLTAAGALGDNLPNAVMTTVGGVDPTILLAISAGAVFMGANTYIGNAPNFMVKNIAESNDIKMPSFFGYMKWSLVFLIPLFVIDTIVFFL